MSYVVQSSWENMEIRWDANNGQLLHKSSKRLLSSRDRITYWSRKTFYFAILWQGPWESVPKKTTRRLSTQYLNPNSPVKGWGGSESMEEWKKERMLSWFKRKVEQVPSYRNTFSIQRFWAHSPLYLLLIPDGSANAVHNSLSNPMRYWV